MDCKWDILLLYVCVIIFMLRSGRCRDNGCQCNYPSAESEPDKYINYHASGVYCEIGGRYPVVKNAGYLTARTSAVLSSLLVLLCSGWMWFV